MLPFRLARRYFSTTCTRRSHFRLHTEDQLTKRKIKLSSNHIISIIKNDLATEEVDIIVNPSFSGLKQQEGISSDLVAKGGNKIQEQCNEILRHTGKLNKGQVVSTSAGSLPAKYIFHAAAPTFIGNPNPGASMALVIQNCLQKAGIIKCNSISIPILVKYLEYPREEAVEYMVKGVLDWCQSNKNVQPLDIRFVNLEDEIVNEFIAQLDQNIDNNDEKGSS